jgi:hypothetical protein
VANRHVKIFTKQHDEMQVDGQDSRQRNGENEKRAHHEYIITNLLLLYKYSQFWQVVDSHRWPSAQAALHDQFVIINPLLYHRFTTIHSIAQTGLHIIISSKYL